MTFLTLLLHSPTNQAGSFVRLFYIVLRSVYWDILFAERALFLWDLFRCHKAEIVYLRAAVPKLDWEAAFIHLKAHD